MSTPNPMTFPPLKNGFTWQDSAVDEQGNALPPGEALQSTTLGIRADGDATHSSGNYKWLVVVPGPASSETLAALTAALGAALPPGNYWVNATQTDVLSGASSTSAWGTEVPFSIPFPVVRPAAPTQLSVS